MRTLRIWTSVLILLGVAACTCIGPSEPARGMPRAPRLTDSSATTARPNLPYVHAEEKRLRPGAPGLCWTQLYARDADSRDPVLLRRTAP